MKFLSLLILLAIILPVPSFAQRQTENIIIITTDGFRWQEVFKGMDSAIANNSKFNQGDSEYIYKTYWSNDEVERRKKLMPFLSVSYTHLRAHETVLDLVCRLLLEKKKHTITHTHTHFQ